MNLFAETNEKTTEVELAQLHKLLKDWLQAEFDSYNYGAEAIAMVSDNQVIFLETPEEIAKLTFKDIKFGSDDGVLKVEFDNDGKLFHFGFLTGSKIKKMSEEFDLPISTSDDEKTINELQKRQGVKVTPLKSDNLDEFLNTIKK